MEELDIPHREWEIPTDGTLRLAVVGVGDFARRTVLPAIAETDNCETGVVVSGTDSAVRDAAETFDARGLTYEEFHDGDAVEAYDAAYVATPTGLHLPFVETAASLDKHVICEKPLESDAERAEQAVEACEREGVRLITAYRMHAERTVRWVREAVRAGRVGEVVDVHGAFSSSVERTGWRTESELGGGALLDLGVYPLNTARFVLEAEPERITGTTATPHEGFDVDDEHVAFLASFPDGGSLEGRASFRSHSQNYIEVVGTEGRVRIDDAFGVEASRTLTYRFGNDAPTVTVGDVEGTEIVDEFDLFAQAILTDTPVTADGAEGLRDLRLIDAVFASAVDGGSRRPTE